MKTEHRKQIGTGLIILIIAVCLIPSFALAFPQDRGGKGGPGFDQMGPRRTPLTIWRNAKLVKELELTDAQVAEIQDADFAAREKQLALTADLGKLRLEIDRSFAAETVDEAAVRKAAEKISDLRGQMYLQQIDARLALVKILTVDQAKKLKDIHSERKGGRHGQKRMAERR